MSCFAQQTVQNQKNAVDFYNQNSWQFGGNHLSFKMLSIFHIIVYLVDD